ncbi:uncharacterized protein LOC113931950 isoform X1 [Zalophus californianus]|uniref:Uncharacterized protein LOC113931950 isoform X1 n=2 Tax=Zalophus californianus TaxID=9704 RepID=A0A6P9EWQ8_ZALCA|nr:uncharacterized protein LOC113931950 isoform X1 [Zalophus californianus]
MVPTQPLLALGFLPPPLGAAAASHPHFRLLRPEIPELAHPPGCDVTAAPCRAGPQDDSPPRERGAGPAPDQQRGAGLRRRRATLATGRSVAVRLLRPRGLPSPPPADPPPPTRRGTLCRPALSTRRASAATHRTQAPNPGAGTGRGFLGPILQSAPLCSLLSRSARGWSFPWRFRESICASGLPTCQPFRTLSRSGLGIWKEEQGSGPR